MTEPSDARDSQLEEIVAYLDGELSAGDNARVEERLATDEGFRRQLQSAQRVWAALDELPHTRVDDRFSRTTIEMVVQAASEEVQAKTLALPVIQRRRRTTTFLATAAGLALGFLGFRLAWQNPNRVLMDDLPVVAGIDAYSQIQDAAFLRTLHKRVGRGLTAPGAKADEIAVRASALADAEHAPDRGQWIRQLSDSEKTGLRAQYNRFRDLSGQEQDRLRELHAEIAAAPDADELRQTMVAYQQWLGALSPERQYELRGLPPEERIAAIADWSVQMRDEEALTLTPAELRSFADAIRKPLDEIRRRFVGAMRENSSDRRGGGGLPMRQEFGGLRRAVAWQFTANRGGEEGDRPLQSAVAAALPQRSRQRFDELPPQQKIDRVMAWMRQALALEGRVTQAELEQFFAEELDVETRSALLNLPAGQMHERLLALYRQQPGMRFDRPQGWGGEGARGPWGPGGPRDRGGPPRGGRPGGPGGPDGGFGPPREFGPPPDDRNFGPPRDRRPPPDAEGFGSPRDFGPPRKN